MNTFGCYICCYARISKTKIRNEHVRGSVKASPVVEEKRRKWNGHVKMLREGDVLRRMLDTPVPGKKRRGRQKTRGKNHVKEISKVWG